MFENDRERERIKFGVIFLLQKRRREKIERRLRDADVKKRILMRSSQSGIESNYTVGKIRRTEKNNSNVSAFNARVHDELNSLLLFIHKLLIYNFFLNVLKTEYYICIYIITKFKFIYS